MLWIEAINDIIVIISTIVIVICSLGIVIATKFQRQQKKKYQECLKLINEKENGNLIKNGLGSNDIKKINKNIDINKLMTKLYDKYLEFINKINKNDKDFNNILTGFMKEFYENKIDIYNSKEYFEIVENIELINYSILEFDNDKLKFRINTTCFNYKKRKDEIISGSNLEKIEQIVLLTYVKQKREWLISNIEKVYEKKLGI